MKLGDKMSNAYELRIINKPLYYIELVALLNRVVMDRTYRQISLNEKQNSFLDLLKKLRIKGFELFEFYLYDQIDDINTLEKVLISYTQNEFLYLLCGEVFSREEIKLLLNNFNIIDELKNRNEYIAEYDWENIRYAFENTMEFTSQLIDIFRALNLEVLTLLDSSELYKESLSRVSADLKAKLPLEVAQGIMGKKFKRVYDFTTYYFVPSYFFIDKPMRTFNSKTQIVIYPIQEVNQYDKRALANALRIIGDNTRLEIIEKLSKRPMFGKELAHELNLGTSTVSHHLEQLRSIGLIHEEREKNTKYFSINQVEFNKLCDALKNFIAN